MIPYGKQCIDDDDIAAVVASLKSDYLTTGPEVEAFEREFAAFVGAKHAIAVNNATAALHLAMVVAEIGPGDRVVTSPNTFLASANCAAYVGAIPDFSDICPTTYNLCPQILEENWKSDTKAVIAVDYAGRPCEMPEIARIARKNGAIIIEDACHGTGGGFMHEGNFHHLGGHPWADMTTFSFHPVKTLTTGEGGMLVTDNEGYAKKARMLRSHGVCRDAVDFEVFTENPISGLRSPISEPGPWTYEMQSLGYNYRITDFQCALGRSQLRKLPRFIQRRQKIVDHYNSAFADLDWLTTPHAPSPTPHAPISWHLYTAQIDFPALGKTRTEVMQELREQGIGTQVLYIPVYLQPWYQQTYGYAQGKCPNAEAYYLKALSLPLYPDMTDDDVEKVMEAVLKLKG